MTTLEIVKRLGITGYLQPPEVEQLTELAISKDVLEIGSFMGLSAYLMARVARSVMCVDTFKADGGGQAQEPAFTTLAAFDGAVSRFSNVKRFIGTSEDAAGTGGVDGKYDFIFIDAMHTYEAVQSDIAAWWPRLEPGGMMAFHDYGHEFNPDGSVLCGFPGVKTAVDEKFGPLKNCVCSLAWITKA